MVKYRKLEVGDQKKLIEIFKQLSAHFEFHKFDAESLINDERIGCLVAEKDNQVVGFASLISYQTPTKGWIGRIEDVIVHENFRGQGIGRGLVERLIEIAMKKNLALIDLTSNPKREIARKLYESLGFKIGETEPFRLVLGE